MARNSLGGFLILVKPLPSIERKEYRQPFQCWIGVVRYFTEHENDKIVQHHSLQGTTQPFSCGGKDPVLITDDILEAIRDVETSHFFRVRHVDDF